jgi:hypothetical protein
VPPVTTDNPEPGKLPGALSLSVGRIRREAFATGLAVFGISASALVVNDQVAEQALHNQIRSQLGHIAAVAADSLDTRPGGGVISPGAPAPGSARALLRLHPGALPRRLSVRGR